MPLNRKKILAFDIETGSDYDTKYALQPFRAMHHAADITSYATAAYDDNHKIIGVVKNEPSREDLYNLLVYCIDNDITIIGWNVSFDAAWLCGYGLTNEVMKVKWLDGMLLLQHLEREPEYNVQRNKRQSFGLKPTVARFFPKYANYDDGVDFFDNSPTMVAKRLKYNKLDAIFTLRLTEKFYTKLEQTAPKTLRNALIEASVIAPISRSIVGGLQIDKEHALDLQVRLAAKQDELGVILQGHGLTEKILASPKQLATKLYSEWGLPVLVETPKGGPSTDKVALHMLGPRDDRVAHIREYREAANNRTKFVDKILDSVAYNEDGRTRPWPRIYGTYCVPGDVEVLTPQGWRRIDTWQGGPIAQVTARTCDIEFRDAGLHRAGMETNWVRVQTEQGINCDFTGQHMMPHFEQRGLWRVLTVDRLITTKSQVSVPCAGVLRNYTPMYTDAQTRVLCMVQADGSFTTKKGTHRPIMKLTLKKERKVSRAQQLLDAAGIQYRVYETPSYPGRVEIIVGARSVPDWLGPWCKRYGPWVFDTNLRVLIDEVVHWDGSAHIDGCGLKYTSSITSDVEWVATVASLCNMRSSVHAPCTNTTGQTMYTAYVSTISRPIRTIHPGKHMSKVQHAREAFCPVTDTGFWLARANGVIFVTGNSGRVTYNSSQGRGKEQVQTGFALHQMKRDKDFRKTVIAPPGYVLCEWDAAGQEYRWMAIESGDTTMLGLCEVGQDPHAYMGAEIGHRDYFELVLQNHAGDAAAKNTRQLGKVGNLSCQYRIGAKKLWITANVQFGMPITEEEAATILNVYHQTYPGVKQYWTRQIHNCRRSGYAETLAGRRVQLNGSWINRQTAWQLESTAVNFPIQGIGADQKYLAIKILQNYLTKYGGRFYFELHDGLYAILPERTAEQAARVIRRALSNLPYQKAWKFTPPIPLPWDLKMGPSWGEMKEVPDE